MPVYRVKRKAIRVVGGDTVEPGGTIELSEKDAQAFADNLETEADQEAAAKIEAAKKKAAEEIAKAEAKAAEEAEKATAKAEADKVKAAKAGGN